MMSTTTESLANKDLAFLEKFSKARRLAVANYNLGNRIKFLSRFSLS